MKGINRGVSLHEGLLMDFQENRQSNHLNSFQVKVSLIKGTHSLITRLPTYMMNFKSGWNGVGSRPRCIVHQRLPTGLMDFVAVLPVDIRYIRTVLVPNYHQCFHTMIDATVL